MNAPETIYHVSSSIFSIARYYGGCEVYDTSYVYEPLSDTLIRDDIFKARAKEIDANKRHEAQNINDMFNEARMDIIGKNGNDGDHYD